VYDETKLKGGNLGESHYTHDIHENADGKPLGDYHEFIHGYVLPITFRLLKRAELRQVRFHDLRHSFASILLQNGESPVYVKEQLGGHSSIAITVDLYGHLIPGGNRQAVDRLDTPQHG
jgi:integrase